MTDTAMTAAAVMAMMAIAKEWEQTPEDRFKIVTLQSYNGCEINIVINFDWFGKTRNTMRQWKMVKMAKVLKSPIMLHGVYH